MDLIRMNKELKISLSYFKITLSLSCSFKLSIIAL